MLLTKLRMMIPINKINDVNNTIVMSTDGNTLFFQMQSLIYGMPNIPKEKITLTHTQKNLSP